MDRGRSLLIPPCMRKPVAAVAPRLQLPYRTGPMKRRHIDLKKLHRRVTDLSAEAVDSLYGLEPVYEPGATADDLTQFVSIQCPYCGEHFDTRVDLSAGSFNHIEDCQVCCQPIELSVQIDEPGAGATVNTRRAD